MPYLRARGSLFPELMASLPRILLIYCWSAVTMSGEQFVQKPWLNPFFEALLRGDSKLL